LHFVSLVYSILASSPQLNSSFDIISNQQSMATYQEKTAVITNLANLISSKVYNVKDVDYADLRQVRQALAKINIHTSEGFEQFMLSEEPPSFSELDELEAEILAFIRHQFLDVFSTIWSESVEVNYGLA